MITSMMLVMDNGHPTATRTAEHASYSLCCLFPHLLAIVHHKHKAFIAGCKPQQRMSHASPKTVHQGHECYAFVADKAPCILTCANCGIARETTQYIQHCMQYQVTDFGHPRQALACRSPTDSGSLITSLLLCSRQADLLFSLGCLSPTENIVVARHLACCTSWTGSHVSAPCIYACRSLSSI